MSEHDTPAAEARDRLLRTLGAIGYAIDDLRDMRKKLEASHRKTQDRRAREAAVIGAADHFLGIEQALERAKGYLYELLPAPHEE